ncbi:3-deoxy-manno-octulosonate cytidylyltransferase [bacterium]|nr:3-deoxy-manno-octulosonate cytidylyltransferase [bacterium]
MARDAHTGPTPRGVGLAIDTDAADGGVLVVIPARYGSSRFPGKALADLHGRPLIVRVAENAQGIRRADRVVVATDDARIHAAVTAAGFDCEMTAEHPTGTDRIAEVASRHRAALVVNLQGDEPLLPPGDVDALIAFMQGEPAWDLGTCAHPFADEASWRDPNAVKVVTARDGGALYFSRAPIPGMFPGRQAPGHAAALRHVGLYAYRRAALLRFSALPPTPLEQVEGLEQLRALENGLRIGVVRVESGPVGVDTPADLERVRAAWPAGR